MPKRTTIYQPPGMSDADFDEYVGRLTNSRAYESTEEFDKWCALSDLFREKLDEAVRAGADDEAMKTWRSITFTPRWDGQKAAA